MHEFRPATEIARDLERFADLSVLVVGDFFIDEYIEGIMFEISREGPIPVLRCESRRRSAGAAGNLAASIRNLGARVRVVGMVGGDANGGALRAELDGKGIDTRGLLVCEGQPTFTYTKIRARVASAPSREILRLDVLPDGPPPRLIEDRMIAAVREHAADAHGIIVLDQVSCAVTDRLLDELPEIARRSTCRLHGSSRERSDRFRSFDLLIPNEIEAAGALGLRPTSPPEELGEGLRRAGGHDQVLVTLGPEGMAAFPRSSPMVRLPTFARDVVDVTGAGDAVASTAMLGNLLGWDLPTIAWTASHAAAIAVAHPGTHHVTRQELEEAVLAAGV